MRKTKKGSEAGPGTDGAEKKVHQESNMQVRSGTLREEGVGRGTKGALGRSDGNQKESTGESTSGHAAAPIKKKTKPPAPTAPPKKTEKTKKTPPPKAPTQIKNPKRTKKTEQLSINVHWVHVYGVKVTRLIMKAGQVGGGVRLLRQKEAVPVD